MLVCALLANCSPTPASLTPSPLPAAAAPSVPASLPRASVVIEQLSVLVQRNQRGDPFLYEPRFRLRETGGQSGATIQNVAVIGMTGDSDNTGPSCWRDTLRVPPGGILETFYTDAGVNGLSYCAPSSSGATETVVLRVVVTFTDDDGRSGVVEATARR